jgi:hypothetical protein
MQVAVLAEDLTNQPREKMSILSYRISLHTLELDIDGTILRQFLQLLIFVLSSSTPALDRCGSCYSKHENS